MSNTTDAAMTDAGMANEIAGDVWDYLRDLGVQKSEWLGSILVPQAIAEKVAARIAPLHAENDRLNAALSEARAALEQRWISVDERIPEPGQLVLIRWKSYAEVEFSPSVAFWNGTVWHHENWNREADKERVASWQPLPKS